MHRFINKLRRSKPLLGLVGLFMVVAAAVISTGSAHAAYNDMPSVLPDRDPSNQNFINLTDGKNGSLGGGANLPTSYLKVYAQDNGAKTIRFGAAERYDISDNSACRNYSIGWKINMLDANGAPTGSGPSGVEPVNGCTVNPVLPDFGFVHNFTIPAGALSRQTNVPGYQDLYVGLLRLDLINTDPSGFAKSAALRIESLGSKIGYAKSHTVTIYPSYDKTFGNTIAIRFRPPCSAAANPNTVATWLDDDYGSELQQIGDPEQNIYFRSDIFEYPPGGNPIKSTPGRNRSGPNDPRDGFGWNKGAGVGQVTFASRPGFSYELRFSGVDGANGIGINMPGDSNDFYVPCPPQTGPPPWHLNAASGIAREAAPFTGGRANAADALANARFRHYLSETLGQTDARNGEHKWVIKYRYKRYNGEWRTNTTTSDSDGEERTWGDDCKKNNPCSINVPKGSPVLLKDGTIPGGNRASIYDNLKYLFYKDNGRDQRTPAVGDQYCELLVNRFFKAGNSAQPTSTWQCVTLSNNPPCEAWVVYPAKSVTGGGLGGNPGAAWVGETYNSNYGFANLGPAYQTKYPINFYYANQGAPGGPANPASKILGSQAFTYPHGIGAANGGQTVYDQMAYNPNRSAGADNCGQAADAPPLTNQIYVPFYYHITSATSPLGSTTQQGDQITAQVNADLPDVDTGGSHTGEAAGDSQQNRKHTYSMPLAWRLIEFKTTDDANAKAKIPKNKSGANGDCGDIYSYGIAVAGGCSVVKNDPKTFTIGNSNLSYLRPAQLDPIGTKLCYVGVILRPVEQDDNPSTIEGPIWRYSDVTCTTIVKSPKMQFLNGDLTVGRHRKGDGSSATQSCAVPETNASIQAAGAPSYVYANPTDYPNLYGSWVEYGAFAPGNIVGFGTAAIPVNATSSTAHQKLMFNNDSLQGGKFSFGSAGCLSNPFDMVSEDPAQANYLPAKLENLVLNRFFTTAPYDKQASDHTGYVANKADGSNPKNITITQDPSGPPLDDNFGAFRARDIVIYAKKGPGDCTNPNAGGNITLKTDINYASTGYNDIGELPRIVLMADCKIIIEDGVKRVDAWLVAKDAVATCSAATGAKFTDKSVTQDNCKDQLFINGPVQANRLLLWRTHGADLTSPEAKEAAEVFDLRPDQLLATYARGRDAGKPQTVYQVDLPPLY